LSIFAFAGSLTRPAPNYRAANGRGITSLRFDAGAGALAPVAERNDVDDAGWLTIDVVRQRLYAVCEVEGTDQSWLVAFAVGADGGLTELDRQPTGGQTGCHASLSPDGRFVLVANYNAAVPEGFPEGSVAVFPVTESGLAPAAGAARHNGHGPNAARQERAHAHCVVVSPDGRFAYVADLGLDRIVAYALGVGGELTPRPAGDFAVPPGTGPRHLAFNAAGDRLFMVSELVPTVFSFTVDSPTRTLTLVDSFAIERFGKPIVQPAGILRTEDGRFLFIGLRECDEILGLAVDAGGQLSQTGRWPANGATPRDFALSPDGRHLVVANQDDDRLTVFPIADGRLGAPVQSLALGTPMAIALADF